MITAKKAYKISSNVDKVAKELKTIETQIKYICYTGNSQITYRFYNKDFSYIRRVIRELKELGYCITKEKQFTEFNGYVIQW